MCRNAKFCTLLGEDPAHWSSLSPLPPPEWFASQLDIFEEAVVLAVAGSNTSAIEKLRTMRSDEMRAWFNEHGQVSGRHRARKLGIASPNADPSLFDPIRLPTKLEAQVFERDHYTCRYCGLRLLSKEVLIAFERAVGSAEFRTRGTNAVQHGAVHAFKIVADHIVPFKKGGRTNLENLVAACPGCNYGKEAFTIEQLGLEDPRNRAPTQDAWDGLLSLVSRLAASEVV